MENCELTSGARRIQITRKVLKQVQQNTQSGRELMAQFKRMAGRVAHGQRQRHEAAQRQEAQNQGRLASLRATLGTTESEAAARVAVAAALEHLVTRVDERSAAQAQRDAMRDERQQAEQLLRSLVSSEKLRADEALAFRADELSAYLDDQAAGQGQGQEAALRLAFWLWLKRS